MSSLSPRQVARNKLASLRHSLPADDPAVIAARRELIIAGLEESILRAVEGWPPLTDDQRDELVALLAPGLPAGGDG